MEYRSLGSIYRDMVSKRLEEDMASDFHDAYNKPPNYRLTAHLTKGPLGQSTKKTITLDIHDRMQPFAKGRHPDGAWINRVGVRHPEVKKHKAEGWHSARFEGEFIKEDINEQIVRLPNGHYKVVSKKTGQPVGEFPTYAQAVARNNRLHEEENLHEGDKNEIEANSQPPEGQDNQAPKKPMAPPKPVKTPKARSSEPDRDKVKLGEKTPIILAPTSKDTEYNTDTSPTVPGRVVAKSVVESKTDDDATVTLIHQAIKKGRSVQIGDENITPESWKTHKLNPNREKPAAEKKEKAPEPEKKSDPKEPAAGHVGKSPLEKLDDMGPPKKPIKPTAPAPSKPSTPPRPTTRPVKPKAPRGEAPRAQPKRKGILTRFVGKAARMVGAALKNKSILKAHTEHDGELLDEVSQKTAIKYLKKGDPAKFRNDDKKFARRMKGNELAMKKVCQQETVTRIRSMLAEDRLENYLVESITFALELLESRVNEKVLQLEFETKYPEVDTSRKEWLTSVKNLHDLRVALSNAGRVNDGEKVLELQQKIADATHDYATKFVIENGLNELHGKGKLKGIEDHHEGEAEKVADKWIARSNGKTRTISHQEHNRELAKHSYHGAQASRAYELSRRADAMKEKRHVEKDISSAKKESLKDKIRARQAKQKMSEDTQLDEISQERLGNYLVRATKDLAHMKRSKRIGSLGYRLSRTHVDRDIKHREEGIPKAREKLLHKEDLDEAALNEMPKRHSKGWLVLKHDRNWKESGSADDKTHNTRKDARKAAQGHRSTETKGYRYTSSKKQDLDEAAHAAGGGQMRAGLETGGDHHIVTQLRKVVSMKGAKVTFGDKSVHHVHPIQAHKALDHHDTFKTSHEKGDYSTRLGASHQSFMDTLAGKSSGGVGAHKKSKISLGGSPRVGGSNPNWRHYRNKTLGLESVQIDEVSKKTLRKYVGKAIVKQEDHAEKIGANKDIPKRDWEKYRKHRWGIHTALDKMTKEETVNEISDNKLNTYVGAAERDKDKQKGTRRYGKRVDGVRLAKLKVDWRALNRTRHEETQLDEGKKKKYEDPEFPDTHAGAIAALKHISIHDVKGATARPDPHVKGVWQVNHKRGKSIVYLKGHSDPLGRKREHNDFEDQE